MDNRWTRLGDILVNYSTRVAAGERVMIAMQEIESFPLAQAVYEAVIRAGGYPQVQLLSEKFRRSLLKHGNTDQLNWLPEIEAYGMDWADVYINLRGAPNYTELWDIPPEKISILQDVQGRISTLRWQKTRWCVIRVPNLLFAQQAGVDEDTILDMFFNASLLDWDAEAARWNAWAQKLNGCRQVQILGPGTDLSFSVDGRKWVVGSGHINMPDGEIMTSPVVESVNGRILFDTPALFGGRIFENIQLVWEHGTLVHADATNYTDYLNRILHTDAGSEKIGEFAFGVNPNVTLFCKDIFLDEKIDKTVHIAMGRAYPECGGTNKSAIHWDIIKDLRREGSVNIDGYPVLKDGVYLFDR